MGPTAGLARRTTPSSFSMITASEVLPRTAASVLRSSASAWYARALSSADPSPARDESGDLKVVGVIHRARPAGEEQRARHLHAAPHRHPEHGPEPGSDEDVLERARPIGGGQVFDHHWLTGAHGSPRQPFIRCPAPRTDVVRQGSEGVDEVSGLLRGRQANGEIVARHRGRSEIGERLEEMGRDGRARQGYQDVGEPREALGQAHVGWSSSAQCRWTSSTSRAAVGTASIGPTTEMCRISPCLSTRKTPCSTAVMA